MILFRKKNSESENSSSISDKSIIQEFDNYFESYHNKDYNNVLNVYNHIKSVYKNKIENKEIDITIEKIRLEKNVGKYQSSATKNSTAIITGMICVFIQFAIIDGMKILGVQNDIIKYFLTYVVLFWFLNYMGKDTSKSKPNDIMINISLKVLDELEKEDSKQNVKQEELENQDIQTKQLKSKNINNREELMMLAFQTDNKYGEESKYTKKIKSTFEKISNEKIRNNYYIQKEYIKSRYITILGNDIDKIKEEKKRVLNEIENGKTPVMTYLMGIVGLVFTFFLKSFYDLLVELSKTYTIFPSDMPFWICVIISVSLLGSYGGLFVRMQRTFTCYKMCDDVLQDLIDEVNNSKTTVLSMNEVAATTIDDNQAELMLKKIKIINKLLGFNNK